VLIAL